MKNIILLILIMVFSLGLVDSKKEEPVDIWYRTVPDVDNAGETLIYKLDMSIGYAYCDGYYIYLVIKRVDVDKPVIIAFKNNDYWLNDESHWITPENLEKEIESKILKEYFEQDSGKIESIK